MVNNNDEYQFDTGEKPPNGIYVCMSCIDAETILVPEMAKVLPQCQKCGYTQWYRV